jgi:UDP-N-acetylglucosamine 2-epimerase (non-hydrolysing)
VIAVVYGTTGELIKLAPVLVRLRDRGVRYLNVTTAQQVEQIGPLLDQLGLQQPDLWLGNGAGGRDLHTNADIPRWLATLARRFAKHARRLRRLLAQDGRPPMVLVHGDTMSTVLGTLIGRTLRATVAHIEAGVRTWDVLHPFPEELNRRAVSRIAHVHYAPGHEAAANLRRGRVVDTGMNTIRDSIELCPTEVAVPVAPGEEFGIVSLHRYELLKSRELLGSTLTSLARSADEGQRLLFIDHPVTVAAIRRWGLDNAFGERFVRFPRLDFFGFVDLLRRCAFVVTDSGGTQLETYVLDKPCLVHRKKVEQAAGLGENVVVSGFSTDVLADFLTEPARYRRHTTLPAASPSDVIVGDLVERGFVG